MLLLQSPSFKGFFEKSQVFAELLKDVLEEAKRDGENFIDEEQYKMVAQLCTETIIKHNLNEKQVGRCALKIYIDADNSKEVRKYFSLLKQDARKDIKARALNLKIEWIQNIFCLVMSRQAQVNNRAMWNELKTEFLAFTTK